MDHDRLFKELLKTFFVEFVELFLPDVAQYMEKDSIEFLDKEIFTDIASGERHEVDLLVKARFRGFGEGYFLIHVEPQSTPRALFTRRMFGYFARLHENYLLPVYPVAIFSYDKPLRPEPDRYQVEFPGFRVLDFAFRVIQLNRLNWRDFLRTPNPVASALMVKMQIAPEDRPRVKLECLRMLATLKLDKARATLISAFMDAYLKLSAAEAIAYNRELESIEPREREVVMQLTNEWIERGKVEGREEGRREAVTQLTNEWIERGKIEGREEGRQEGRRELVVRLLRRRVGPVPADLLERVGHLSDSKIEELADALFDFQSLADAQIWLSNS